MKYVKLSFEQLQIFLEKNICFMNYVKLYKWGFILVFLSQQNTQTQPEYFNSPSTRKKANDLGSHIESVINQQTL